jgi:hypothetical protein
LDREERRTAPRNLESHARFASDDGEVVQASVHAVKQGMLAVITGEGRFLDPAFQFRDGLPNGVGDSVELCVE